MNARIDHRNIPSAIANQLGWMPYTLKHNPETRKLEKKPVLRGWADSTDSLELCLWKCRNNPDWLPGLSLNPDVNKLILVDFDNVKVGGDFTAEAMGYVKSAQTLTEVSASGNGLHCIATAEIDKNYKHKYLLNYGQCELYWKSRFVALTFDWRLDAPQTIGNFESIPEILPFVYEVGRTTRDSADGRGNILGYGDTPKYPVAKATFEGLLYHLNRAKNREQFSKLYNGAYIHDGQWLGNDDYPSQNEADLSLCTRGLWYAISEQFQSKYIEDITSYDNKGQGFSIVDKLMRRSGLNRGKWKRFDYKLSTLHLAYETITNPYNPVEYFNEHYKEEFSDTQRYRQGLSANKRSRNYNVKVFDAIHKLELEGVRLSLASIARESGTHRDTVAIKLKAEGLKLVRGNLLDL